MKVIICRVGEEPVIEDINHSLENMQVIVNGQFDCISLADDIDLWCNDEFLYNGSTPNRFVKTLYGGEISINGTFFLASSNEDGETIGLNNQQLDEWMERVGNFPRMFGTF